MFTGAEAALQVANAAGTPAKSAVLPGQGGAFWRDDKNMAQAHPPVFTRSGQFAVKPAIKETAQAPKTRQPRQKELPLAEATPSTGARLEATNNSPARKGDRTRLQIKAAARVIFARDGFLNSTIAEIMKEAQRAFGVFYCYSQSKDELLLDLTEEL